ncbi:hypothetical protein MBAV_003400, partial [Candidatus Magnetobacterium bavaricum]
MDKSINVTANFAIIRTLNININNYATGSVNVTVDSGSINWSSDKKTGTATYADGTIVTLNATGDKDSSLSFWGIDCERSGRANTCQLTMSKDMNVAAVFGLYQKLTVTTTGNGTVNVDKGGLTWSYNIGTTECVVNNQVTLSAMAFSGFSFMGWGGDCSGTTSTCKITMSKASNVTARFAMTRTLTVTKTGYGNVTASPGGLTW